MIHFLRPEWLLALLPLLAVLYLLLNHKQQQSSWSRYIAPHLAKVLISSSAAARKSNTNIIALCWLIAVLALSGPALTKRELPVFETDQGRVILMDMSLSMYATDLAPNRLTQAKFKATDLIKSLDEGETGLVAYAGEAFTISPLTRDRATLLNLLPTLSPDIMPIMGSNLPAALTQAKNLLIQGGHIQGDIILLTDGVATEQVNRAKKVLSNSQYRLSIIALGSQQGAPIRLPNGQLLRDRSDQIVIPKTDYEALNALTVANGGQVYPYRADGSDLNELNHWLAQSQSTKASDKQGEVWLDLGPYLALLLLLPALLGFRQAFIAIACILLFPMQNPVYANSWQHPWQTDNQRAMQAYQQGDFANAAKLFKEPNWQASAHYRNGDYQQALKLYEQDESATGLYNQGNSLMQMQKFDEAIERYQAALTKNPDLNEAKANLKQAEKLKQEQGQQQEQNSQGDSQSEQDKSQSGQDNSKSSQDDAEEQGQNQQDSGQSQQQDEQSSADAQSAQASSDNEAQMSAAPNKEASNLADNASESEKSAESQEVTQSSQGANASKDEAHASNEEASQAQTSKSQTSEALALSTGLSDDELPPEMQRALGAVIDDPQVLLRNKMQLEYQKRRAQGVTSKESELW
ncbi:VWA domain-containing protein [Shewanella sp. AS1]|uniref:VWA domain-containing protein n=1 Tax=Shewanella sp. AS1 TaxID=2907626 RepID=UPI001F25DCE7|nr:VWA domain-containing protein [Shewanella sp. AS1]MCE9679530.1 VWA domain-containing protein [Shewanella sp. AS1]